MIIAEIKRALKSRIWLLLILLIAVICVVLVIDYDNNFDYGKTGSGYGIRSYKSIEDVDDLIYENEQTIEEYEHILNTKILTEENYRFYQDEIKQLTTQINIYNYIKENNISFEEYNDFEYVQSLYLDNAFSAFTNLCEKINRFLPFIIAIPAGVTMGYDFSCGTYKFIYSSSMPRKKIAKSRYLAWLFVALICGIVVCIAMALIALCFGDCGGKIIFANLSTVFRMNYLQLVLFESANLLLRIFVVGTIIFALSLWFKNMVFPMVTDLVMCASEALSILGNQALNTFLFGMTQIFLGGKLSTIAGLYYLLTLSTIIIITAVIGRTIFIKRDLK